MVTSFHEGVPLWEPTETRKQQANVVRYMQWLAQHRGLKFQTRDELWQWSVTQIEDFWASLWDYFQIKASKPYTTVLPERKMPGADWFPGAELNYAEHAFRNATLDAPALFFAPNECRYAAFPGRNYGKKWPHWPTACARWGCSVVIALSPTCPTFPKP